MSEKYDEYLTRHREAVSDCYKMLTGKSLTLFCDGIPVGHDASKYSKEEYNAYDEFFYPSDGSEVGKDSIRKEAFNRAWLHHQNNNSHHWQYYVLINDNDGIKGLEMPLSDVYEMVADWGSFAYQQKNGQYLRDWYKANRAKQVMHDKTRELVDALVVILARNIDEAFKED